MVKSCVQWFLFVVTALSCLYTALYGGRATFTARDAVEQSLSYYRLTRPPVSLCLNYNSRNSNNLSVSKEVATVYAFNFKVSFGVAAFFSCFNACCVT